MRILVTGGAGFVGSHVVDGYIEEGHKVLVLDDLSTGSEENLNPGASFERCDLRDVERVSRLLKSFHPQVINHHAAQVDPCLSVRDPRFDEHINVAATVGLLQKSLEVGAQTFVFASSGGAIYGNRTHAAGEETSKSPLSPYGAAKVAAEGYVFVFARTLGLRAVSLRYSNVYGPRQERSGETGVVPIFIQRMLNDEMVEIFGDGEQTRDFVYVADVARANRLATDYLLRQKPTCFGVNDLAFNISSGSAVSINSLFGQLAQIVGYSRPANHGALKLGDIRHSVLSPAKAQRVLGFLPKVALDQGLRESVEWLA